MEAKQLALASLDDMVFDGRNKAYGAYQLRQQYNDRITKAAGISFSSVLLLFGLGYAAIQVNPDLTAGADPGKTMKISDVVIAPPPKAAVIPPPQAARAETAKATPTATRQYTEPRITAEQELVEVDFPNQADLAAADPGLVTAAGTPSDGTLPVPEAGAGTGMSTEAVSDKPIDFVEQMPDFADGGQAGMLKFIARHLRYPNRAVAEGLEGIVIVSFVVSASGEVTQVTVLKDLGGGTGEEALRVVSKMPRWKPGVQNHRQVPVRMTLPIRFKLG